MLVSSDTVPAMGRQRTRVSVACEHCGNPSPLNAKRFCSLACHTAAKTIEPAVRFWPKVNKHGPIHPVLGTRCWPWTGSTDPKGYGTFSMPPSKPVKAHRVAWTLTHGEIPDGANVLHRCDNPPCVNADEHLFLGTLADNNRDMSDKGRASGNTTKGRPHLGLAGEVHGMAKLTDAAVRVIRAERAAGSTFVALAQRYRLDVQTVRRAAMRQTWKHVE